MELQISVLINIMRSRHCGVKNAVHKRDLLQEMWGPDAIKDESYNNPFDRDLRILIEKINTEEHGLICSNSRDGYWWAESLKDGLPAAQKNRDRALTQLSNAKNLEKNILDTYGGQMDLFGVNNG